MKIIDPQDVTAANLKTLTLGEIALVTSRAWIKVSPYALPYLEAMYTLKTIEDRYFADTGHYIVTYFLSNAGSWRGEVAKLVKAELNARAKAYEKARKL